MRRPTFSLQTQISAFALAVSLIPLAAVSWHITVSNKDGLDQSTEAASGAITEQLIANLSGQVASKNATITQYLDTIGEQLSTFASNGMVVDAAEKFAVDATLLAPIDVSAAEQRADLARYYHDDFGVRYSELNSNTNSDIDIYLSELDDVALRMQYDYIAQNSYPLGSKEALDRAEGFERYHETHAQFHPWARTLLQSFGYYDVFLVEPKQGRIVYSVFKELDFGTSLRQGPWQDSGIARAFNKALNAAPGEVVIDDFALYIPSYNSPATFLATPVIADGKLVSVAIFQLPLDRISATVDERTGLGGNGEVFVVGADKLLRTDSQLFPEQFSVMKSFREPAAHRLSLPSIDQALAGVTGNMTYESYHGSSVISAFAPLNALGMRWAMVAEVDEGEALLQARAIAEQSAQIQEKGTRQLLIGIGFVIPVICLISIVYGFLLARPVKRMTKALNSVADGDLTPRLAVGGNSEFVSMASAFNQSIEGVRNAVGDDHVDWHEDFGAMRESLSRIQSMVEGSPTSIMMLDDAGVIQYANPAAQQTLLTYESHLDVVVSALAGSSIYALFGSQKELEGHLCSANALPVKQTIDFAGEKLSLDIVAITGGDGHFIGPMINFEVITDRLAIEQQVAAQQQREIEAAAVLQRDIDALMGIIASAAKGDLSLAIPNVEDNGVKQMSAGLSTLFDSLRESFAAIYEHAQIVENSAEELATIGSKMSGNAELTSSESRVVSGTASTVGAHVDSVAASVNQLSDGMKEIANHAAIAAKTATKAVKHAEETNTTVHQLTESSAGISGIVKVINAIAEQTNLLALNATIEAARAGDAGKGFAVVANEVKELAKETSRATEEIERQISIIQMDSEQAVVSINAFGQVIDQINETQSMIADAVVIQTKSTNEIRLTISEVAQGSISIAGSIGSVSQRAEDTHIGASKMQDAARELARMGTELHKQVSRFNI